MPEKFRNTYRVQSSRLQGYDYRNKGAYFITICARQRTHYFGECRNGFMCLSELGTLAQQFWFDIPSHFPNTSLGEFVVMPDHVDGILIVDKRRDRDGSPLVETHNYASLQSKTNIIKTWQHLQNQYKP